MGLQVARAGELRAAIERLPLRTRQAMLEGIQSNPIIVGADGDPRGGVCPVYATARPPSKRVGAPFARAWDRYAGARMPRPASKRELRALSSMLESSIALEADTPPVVSLHAGIAAHKATQARNRAAEQAREEREVRESRRLAERSEPRRDTGERDRSGELSRRSGWGWLRPVRRLDEFERALQTIDDMAREAESAAESEHLVTTS